MMLIKISFLTFRDCEDTLELTKFGDLCTMGFFDNIKKAGQAAQAAQDGLDDNVDRSGPEWEPIEGITIEKYAEISAAMQKDGIMGVDAVNAHAEKLGVPPGKWNEVQLGWTNRMQTNANVRNRYGMLYSAALN